MTKRLIDLDDDLLAEAQRELHTTGVSDTVREALRQTAAAAARARQLAWLIDGGLAELADPDRRWSIAGSKVRCCEDDKPEARSGREGPDPGGSPSHRPGPATAVHAMPALASQTVQDNEWLHEAARRGWPVLYFDSKHRKRRRPAERAALLDGGVREFVLNGNVPAAVNVDRVMHNLAAIVAVCSSPGPFTYRVPAGVRLMAGEHRVDLWMAIPGDVPDGLCLETEVECRTGSLTVRIQAWMWSSTRTALLPAQCVTSREPSTTNETVVTRLT